MPAYRSMAHGRRSTLLLLFFLSFCSGIAVGRHGSASVGVEAGSVESSIAQLQQEVQELRRSMEVMMASQQQDSSSNGSSSASSWNDGHVSPLSSYCERAQETEEEENPLLVWLRHYETGPGLHKVIHYFDAYHHHFKRFRHQPRGDKLVVVEVGVQSGGSTAMWLEYFGGPDRVQYIGVDIDPITKQLERPGVEIVIGNQADREFWQKFKATHPLIDIFIDDGGHTMEQQLVTLDEMFWHVKDGGVFLVEDTCTSYWPKFGGGVKRPGTFMEVAVKYLVDAMHAWYSTEKEALEVNSWTRNVRGMHIYDSMVFLDKGPKNMQEHVLAGDQWIGHHPRRDG